MIDSGDLIISSNRSHYGNLTNIKFTITPLQKEWKNVMVKNTGVKRIVLAFGYSLAGLRSAFKNEAAFRQELLLAVILLPLLFLFDIDITQRLIMVATLILVLIVELINSAIEAIVDRIGTEHHELSGRAKDIGSAAVLVSLFLMTYVWGTVLWSHL